MEEPTQAESSKDSAGDARQGCYRPLQDGRIKRPGVAILAGQGRPGGLNLAVLFTQV